MESCCVPLDHAPLQIAFPHTAVLGRLGSSTVYRNVKQYADAQISPGILAFRIGELNTYRSSL